MKGLARVEDVFFYSAFMVMVLDVGFGVKVRTWALTFGIWGLERWTRTGSKEGVGGACPQESPPVLFY